ncbi:MAG: phosphoenolpyruvate synthase [Proteobacteria bacterium]|jgi:pyruvate,water dikinase|nr:phosphoenolpyruvate synthase [Pseudomonadota bacterium]MDA1301830.1 phosphoenolpyruvate synthase [Pseudomonadota bacterium]
MEHALPFVMGFAEIGADDVNLVGGKNASLGEMYRHLTPRGVRIPNGFAVTAAAYRYLLDSAGAWEALHEALDDLNVDDVDDLARRARAARNVILGLPIPADLADAIKRAYRELEQQYGAHLSVAVRSSATAEDLPTASFAGQHDSFLNISGDVRLLESVRHCFASLFTDRAIRYRVNNGFDHFKVYLSVTVMKMVRSDLAASGVLFTLDTDTGFPDVVFITGAYGLGENVVQGAVDPDEFYVFKPTLRAGYRKLLRRRRGHKAIRMVYADEGGLRTRSEPTSRAERASYCITDAEALNLADAALTIEAHYSDRAGSAVPMDIEWAKDGHDGELYIVQARPETIAAKRSTHILREYTLDARTGPLVEGHAVGASVASGLARVITRPSELEQFQPGEVLVAEMTTPDWGTVMNIAAAIVTDHGGRTCHAAIVARELGIPAIVGCDDATRKIRTGDRVTVSCAEGDRGRVYKGEIPVTVTETDLTNMPRPRTHIMINLGNPALAFQTSMIPNDGVGLARTEFIVAEHIKVHPMALLHPEKITDPEVRAQVMALANGFENPGDYFVQSLAEGVATIAAAFYPKPVVVRMSDFKTNEYAALLGGRWFEMTEANPMIGFRGASRYTHPAYAEGFALECAAIRSVREEMGLVNVIPMIPFCRRIDEARRVLDAMAAHGLVRGENGLEVYVMCEIPNNVILVDAFAALFDGFSIGSNDLTQLTLGVDRDSEILADDFDERDEGVREMIRLAVTGARRNHRHCGFCGQAPSDYPEMAAYLVELGISSISLNPDVVLDTTRHLLAIEQGLPDDG